MIRNLGKLFLTLCLLTVGGGVVANAQIGTFSRMQANVPFSFTVGNTTLPAGRYEIRRLDVTATNVLELRSIKGRTTVVFEVEDAQTPDDQPARKTELVFNTFGDQNFLSQVWVAGSEEGSELAKSRMEKRLVDGGSKWEKHSIFASRKP